MVKILITTIQVNLVLAQNSPELSLLKFLPQEEEKMKQMLNTLNISDFISKCTNYIYIYIYMYNTYIYYRTLYTVVSL